MKLRITSGALRGRCIAPSGGQDGFRPTAERVRQSCINSIRPRIAGAAAADVCAGSGVMGFELLSEGAREVHFVESDWQRGAEIRKHCALLGVSSRARVIEQDVRFFLHHAPAPYDIIFYDPPYEDDALSSLAQQLCTLLAPGGILIYERSKRRAATRQTAAAWNVKERAYGDTVMEFWTGVGD